jgi:hypothetical protein
MNFRDDMHIFFAAHHSAARGLYNFQAILILTESALSSHGQANAAAPQGSFLGNEVIHPNTADADAEAINIK